MFNKSLIQCTCLTTFALALSNGISLKWSQSLICLTRRLKSFHNSFVPPFEPMLLKKRVRRDGNFLFHLRNLPDMPSIEFTRHKQKQNRSTAIILKALLKLPITTKPETSLTSEEGKPLILRYERITHQKARTACWSGWLCRYSARLKSICSWGVSQNTSAPFIRPLTCYHILWMF